MENLNPTLEEILRLTQLLGLQENEDFQRRFQRAIRKNDGRALFKLLKKLRAYASAKLANGSSFPIPIPSQLGDEEKGVLIGHELDTGLPFFWKDFHLNLLAFGSIEQGKSNLFRRLAPSIQERGGTIWFMQRRAGDYDGFLKCGLANVTVIPQLKLNLFSPPPGVNWEGWRNINVTVFSHVYDLMVGSYSYLSRALTKLHEEKYAGTETYPTFNEWHEYLEENVPAQRTDQRGYHDRSFVRIEDIATKWPHILDYCRGYPIEKLTEGKQIVVFNLEPFDQKFSEYLSLMLVYFARRYREANPRPAGFPPLLICFDECQHIIMYKPAQSGHFVTDFDSLVTSSRIVNIGFGFSEQLPSVVSKAAASNTALKICFNLQPSEVYFAKLIMGLSDKQAAAISSLDKNKGEAVLRFTAGMLSTPIRVDIPLSGYDQLMQPIPPKELAELTKPGLADLEMAVVCREPICKEGPSKAVKLENKIAQKPTTGGMLSEDENKLFASIRQHRLLNNKQRAKELSWVESRLCAIADKLSEKGLIEAVECEVGGRGGSSVTLLRPFGEDRNICDDYLISQLDTHFRKLGFATTVHKRDEHGNIPDIMVKLSVMDLPVEVQAKSDLNDALKHIQELSQRYFWILMVTTSAELNRRIKEEVKRQNLLGSSKLWILTFRQALRLDSEEFTR